MTSLRLFLRAYSYLLYFHWLIRRDTSGRLFKHLHRAVLESPLYPVTGVTQEQVAKAINSAIVLLPVETRCLQRASATVKLLREQGILGEMVIGATTFPISAHAWVEIGDQAFNERTDTRHTYTVMERC